MGGGRQRVGAWHGMGKTAVAIYMKHRINDGYGRNYFSGGEKFFCSYVSFNAQMVAKIGLVFQEILNSLLKVKDDIFLEISRNTDESTLISLCVDNKFANAVANNSVRNYLENLLGHSLDMRLTARDWRYDPILTDLFLNQTVRCLKAAGFKGGLLLIDDVENLTDKSTPKQIENFIKDLGIAFFRSGNEASNGSFFTIVFTTHLMSAQKISQAWTVAGLSASFPLAPSGQASILTRKPDMDQCIDIVRQHLIYYRVPSFPTTDELYPFKKDAIRKVIGDCDFHPRRFLSRLNRITTAALGDSKTDITPEFVKTIPEVEDEEEKAPGIEDI